MNEISCCGRNCYECRHFPHECIGCNDETGRVFWLQYMDEVICPIYNCCRNEKELVDCGLCMEHPCWRYEEEKIVPDDTPLLEAIEPKLIDIKQDEFCPIYNCCRNDKLTSNCGLCGDKPCWRAGEEQGGEDLTLPEEIEPVWIDVKVR